MAGGSTSGHGLPMGYSQPAPLTTRSLATHLNQMQNAETGSTSSRVGVAGGGGGVEGGMASHREKVPFDMAYAQAAFNQSRSRSASNANSDVQSTAARRPSGGGMMSMNPGPATNASSGGTGRKSYGQVINQGQSMSIEALLSKPPSGNLMDALKELRSLILSEGIPTDADGHSPLRIYVWCILLGVPPMRSNEYLALVRRGASAAYSKIRNDTFRTLATDPLFRRRVSEASLIRLLNAFAHSLKDTGVDAQYVQGMNVIAAPFLYAAKSETEAFALFSFFIKKECPSYVKPTMEGVHRGLKLVDQCLETVDRELYLFLKEKYLSAELYAFPSVLTLSACTPPLPEVLVLWDFLLAYGPHLNILCVVAQLLLMRKELLAAQSPMKLLRTFPPLQSKKIIQIAVRLVKEIPQSLFDQLVTHAR